MCHKRLRLPQWWDWEVYLFTKAGIKVVHVRPQYLVLAGPNEKPNLAKVPISQDLVEDILNKRLPDLGVIH